MAGSQQSSNAIDRLERVFRVDRVTCGVANVSEGQHAGGELPTRLGML